MKIKYNIILFTLIIIYSLTNLLEPLKLENIYIRNVLLFLIVGMISFMILNTATKKTITSFEIGGVNETLLQGVKIIVFSGILLLTSTIQLNMIRINNIPVSEYCVFYDEYHHPIYENRYSNGCTDLEIVTKTNNYLEFNVIETQNFVSPSFSFGDEDNTTYEDVLINTQYLVTTKINYDDQNRIINTEVLRTEIHQIDAGVRTRTMYATNKVVTTNAYQPFEQVIHKGGKSIIDEQLKTYQLTHMDLNNITYNEVRYYQVENDDIGYDIFKEYSLDGELVEELFVSYSKDENEFKTIRYSLVPEYNITRSYIVSDQSVHQKLDDETIIYDIYTNHDEYGMILSNSVTGNATYYFIETNDRNFYIEHVDATIGTTKYIKDNYYEFSVKDYGLRLEMLSFNDYNVIEYLFNKEEIDSNSDLFPANISFYQSSSIFEINYMDNDLVYVMPEFLK